jgi:hypothetical protein
MVSPKLFTLIQKSIVALPIETVRTAGAARNQGKPFKNGLRFLRIQIQTVLSGPGKFFMFEDF